MIYTFDDFELDLARVELRQGGQVCPVEPQVFALIALLVEHRERLTVTPELVDTAGGAWPGRWCSWGLRARCPEAAMSDAELSAADQMQRATLGDSFLR